MEDVRSLVMEEDEFEDQDEPKTIAFFWNFQCMTILMEREKPTAF